MTRLWISLALAGAAYAQEAESGFDLRGTLSTSALYAHQLSLPPRVGEKALGSFQSILYPTLKFNSHWSLSGAVETHLRPGLREEFTTQGQGLRVNVLQANLSYSRVANNKSLVVRVGQMNSAFGSFLLRYDPATNPVVGMPLAYGYYAGVTTVGLMGAQADITLGRLDARAQFVNSSPMNRRNIFDRDQYGNWAGGAGWTVRQGFRVGASVFRGPYLHRGYAFYFPGEAKPRDLAATGYGVDVQWARGQWNVYGELQRFVMQYQLIPTFTQHTGYVEVRRVLNPRWYAATRVGYIRASAYPGWDSYELAAGFRPNRFQLLKFDYEIQHGRSIRGTLANVAAVQLVTSFHPISLARD